MNLTTPIMKIEKKVDAREFLKILSTNRDKIYSSKIVLPKLGSDSLGSFKITYK